MESISWKCKGSMMFAYVKQINKTEYIPKYISHTKNSNDTFHF